jgi:diguanylate cyclase (GGDEF)-like protein
MAADACVLFLRQEGDTLLAAAASGAFADRIEGQRLPLGWGLSGAVAQSGLPPAPHRLAQDDLGLLAGSSAWGHKLVHALSAPLVNELGSIGALTLYRAGDAPFTEDDARLLATVAAQATVAVSNAREYEQTRQSALTDGLTGLANARCFRIRLDQELSRARQEKQPLSLIAIDLDGLKYVNDTHGHQSGDRVLCTVAEVFRRHVREVDTVVRYAGDEFFIIVPDIPNRQISDMQHRLKAAVRATSVQVTPGNRIGLSASFGAATFPGDAQQAEALIAAADAAMYADKRLNRQAALIRAGVGRAGARPEEPVEATAARAATPQEAEGGDGKQA